MSAEIKKKKSTPKVVSTEPIVNDQTIYKVIAKKAYELYEKRGEGHGHDLEDWLEAERLVLSDEKTVRSA